MEMISPKGPRERYYSQKNVAELFDVSKQTVYLWIEEGKIECENSSGKLPGEEYWIPKEQFQTKDKMNKIDPTFTERREKEMEGIPVTDFDPGSIVLPVNAKYSLSHDEIKRYFTRKKK